MTIGEHRRLERAHFLRKRRESILPCEVGLPNGVRRRTPGLRREEVAVLAGVSPTWYTYLEQGRDVSPSPDVLDGLASVLGLSVFERDYLVALSREPDACAPSAGTPDSWKYLEAVAENMYPFPAYVCSLSGDLIGWNRAVPTWLTDFGQLPEQERNLLVWMLTSEVAHRRFVDWESASRHLVARFRAEVTDWRVLPRTDRMIHELSRRSARFREWWDEHRVCGPLTRVHHMRHPEHGVIAVRMVELLHEDPNGTVRLIVHTPLAAEQQGLAAA
ncbi:helix-turn-helix transcriptional regulator [Streptomyces sp. NPDC032472]|uniref:helix-turn-helix transcriptional regulator n=1 Tax=Streptomyces sp. NPDC032472 TaxID=3155018 RepID=UPI0034081D90